MRRILMRLIWIGVFGVVLSVFGLCGSGGSEDPPVSVPPTVQRPVATYTVSAPVVKTGYQGGRPFGKDVSQVASYLNDECYMAFEWDGESYDDFYLMEGFGVSLGADSDTRNGPTQNIGFLLDFTGDLIDEPNASMLSSIAVCMADETGVPFDSVLEWAADNAETILTKGEDGHLDTVRGYFSGAYYYDELLTIVITDF